ncbi:NB-ARC domain-containing protein [Streptomyces phaeochromogenes]|uniref:NB-ARC domain-containing protein n=1 Tax=Streptomyces phaeochromogenes TaxID=1923 RepID=UPI0038685AD8|nr:NB-ARC domain-containing protein [Streptomyces phaeochromogenes]
MTITAAILATLAGLAANPATSQSRWPGVLDVLRRYPWQSLAVLVVLGVAVTVVQWWAANRTAVVAGDPPPPGPPAVPGWVIDRSEVEQVSAAVCSRQGLAVGITTGLHGAGGFGKTTLAEMVCAVRRVRRRFRGRVYVVTVGRDVRGRAAIAAKVAEATRFITGDTATFDDPARAGEHLGRLLDQRPRTLLVIDDVWEPEQLEPFLAGGSRCLRLVTTRIPAVLPAGSHLFHVDQMSSAQARQVLTWDLPRLPEAVTGSLLEATGRWPLLLRLTNRLIAAAVATGVVPATAAADTLRRLREHGPSAVDAPLAPLVLDDPRQRKKAVRATIEAATGLLPPGGDQRFAELGIFAEDEAVPLSAVARLWQATAGLSEAQCRELCRILGGLSLLTLHPQTAGGSITLHDVIRDYLRSELGSVRLTTLNAAWVDAVEANLPTAPALLPGGPQQVAAWWEAGDGYLLDHATDHLLAAGRTTHAENLACDLRWVETRLHHRGPTAPWRDLTRIPTAMATERARDLARTAHLLQPTDPAHALTAILHSRLQPLPGWRDQVAARQRQSNQPALVNGWVPPDLPDPALERILTDHTFRMNMVAISPDGSWLATGGDGGTVRIWDRATGTSTATLTGHTGPVLAVAISPDGSWLATSGGDDGTVRIWDRATGTSTATLTGHTGPVLAVAISPDGTWLATSGRDEKLRVWDRATGTSTATLTGHTGPVLAVAISPDGTWLATSGRDEKLRVWDRATGTTTAILTGWRVAISPDGTWLATGGDDGTVRIWDQATATVTATLTGHTDSVYAVAISPDGTWLAAGGSGKTVRIWDRATATVTATLTGHTDSVRTVAISPDGTWLATGSTDGTVRIWDRTTATVTGRTSPVLAVAISPDGSWLATSGRDRRLRIWDRATGTTTATLTGSVNAVAISPDGSWLATGGDGGTVRIWDQATATVTATLTGHTGPVLAVAISPDGTWLATGSTDATVRIWERPSGNLTATLTGHTDWVRAVAISPDGTWLATTSVGDAVRIWDRVTGTTTATLTDSAYAVAISPDGTSLATASGRLVRIWDRATGTTTTTLTGHTSPVLAVAFSPDGTWLATVSHDQAVQIWDMRTSSACTMLRTEAALVSCAWTYDGRALAIGGEKGVYFYEFRPVTPGRSPS